MSHTVKNSRLRVVNGYQNRARTLTRDFLTYGTQSSFPINCKIVTAQDLIVVIVVDSFQLTTWTCNIVSNLAMGW